MPFFEAWPAFGMTPEIKALMELNHPKYLIRQPSLAPVAV
jgi:hypothetical protein